MSNKLEIRHTILHSKRDEAVAEVWWKPLDITYTDWAFDNIGETIYEFEDESPLALRRCGPDSFELVPVEIRISRSIETTEWEEPRNVTQLRNLIQGTYTAHVGLDVGDIRVVLRYEDPDDDPAALEALKERCQAYEGNRSADV